ncbi:MAG: HAD family hydrolase [bacterium]|nr:HAD family hydrolase [bacterium]
MKLLLFDIDGTLLRGHGRGKQALIEAMQASIDDRGCTHLFGAGEGRRALGEAPLAAPEVQTNPGMQNGIAGKTDLQFVHESLGPELTDAAIAEMIPQIFAEHSRRLREYFTAAAGVELLDGVRELLEEVQRLHRSGERCLPAVLTGNIQAGANIKLKVFGLEPYFVLGAYGDEGRVRRELPPIAVQRARDLTGRDFAGADVVIIGDTPNDIDCGRPLKARTIAVTTGPYARDELAEHEPHAIFDSLADTDRVLSAIFADD